MGDTIESLVPGRGVTAEVVTTTSFSSSYTGELFADKVAGTPLFRAASLARFAKVGTLLPELIFLTSIGLAVTFLATIELLLLFILDPWGICGVRELGVEDVPGVLEPDPDLTLTTFAWARNAWTAGTGGTTAS